MGGKSKKKSKVRVKLHLSGKRTFRPVNGLFVRGNRAHSHYIGKGKDAKNLDHGGIEVVKVERLEHTDLLNKYLSYQRDLKSRKNDRKFIKVESLESKKEKVKSEGQVLSFKNLSKLLKKKLKSKDELNEYYLFHGCSKEAAKSIMETGFDLKETSEDAMFGQGNYFAESPIKADQYAGESY